MKFLCLLLLVISNILNEEVFTKEYFKNCGCRDYEKHPVNKTFNYEQNDILQPFIIHDEILHFLKGIGKSLSDLKFGQEEEQIEIKSFEIERDDKLFSQIIQNAKNDDILIFQKEKEENQEEIEVDQSINDFIQKIEEILKDQPEGEYPKKIQTYINNIKYECHKLQKDFQNCFQYFLQRKEFKIQDDWNIKIKLQGKKEIERDLKIVVITSLQEQIENDKEQYIFHTVAYLRPNAVSMEGNELKFLLGKDFKGIIDQLKLKNENGDQYIFNYSAKEVLRYPIDGLYYQHGNEELISSCDFAQQFFSKTVEIVTQLYFQPTTKFNLCLNQMMNMNLEQNSENNFSQWKKIQDDYQSPGELKNKFNSNEMLNLHFSIENSQGEAYNDQKIVEEYEKVSNYFLDFTCQQFQMARSFNFFNNKELLLKNQKFNSLQKIDIFCQPQEENNPKTKALIFNENQQIGHIIFEKQPSKGAACSKKTLCISLETDFGGSSQIKFKCYTEPKIDLEELKEGSINNFVFNAYYGPTLQLIDDLIEQIQIFSSFQLTFNLIEKHMNDLEIEIQDGIKIVLKVEDIKKGENFMQLEVGFQNYPFSLISIYIEDFSEQGKFLFQMDTGFNIFEVYIDSEVKIKNSDTKSQMEQIINEENLEKQKELISQWNIQQGKLMNQSVQKSLVKILRKMVTNYILKNDENQIDILKDSEFLSPVLNTNYVSFPLAAVLLNFVIMKNNFDRLSYPDAEIQKLINEFKKLQNDKEEIEKFYQKNYFFEKKSQKTDYEEEIQSMTFEEHQNTYGLLQFEDWIYSNQEKLPMGFQEEYAKPKQYDEKLTFKYSAENMLQIINFDGNYLKHFWIKQKRNYFTAIYGSSEFNRKMILRMWYHSYGIFRQIQIQFQLYDFTMEFIVPIKNVNYLISQFQQILVEIRNHGKLTIYQGMKSLNPFGRTSWKNFALSVKKSLDEINLAKFEIKQALCSENLQNAIDSGDENTQIKLFIIDAKIDGYSGECDEETLKKQPAIIMEEKLEEYFVIKFNQNLYLKSEGKDLKFKNFTFKKQGYINVLPVIEGYLFCHFKEILTDFPCDLDETYEKFKTEKDSIKHHLNEEEIKQLEDHSQEADITDEKQNPSQVQNNSQEGEISNKQTVIQSQVVEDNDQIVSEQKVNTVQQSQKSANEEERILQQDIVQQILFYQSFFFFYLSLKFIFLSILKIAKPQQQVNTVHPIYPQKFQLLVSQKFLSAYQYILISYDIHNVPQKTIQKELGTLLINSLLHVNNIIDIPNIILLYSVVKQNTNFLIYCQDI